MQNEEARVSVAMATYNGEQYIREQLDSILHQTLRPFEIIIADDCSQDKTVSILQEYHQQYPIIKLFIKTQNSGVTATFEQALSNCTGDYIALSDQDDIWLPEKLETLVKGIGPEDAVYANSQLVNEKAESMGKEFKSLMNLQSYYSGAPFLLSNSLPGHAFLLKTSFIKKILPFPPGIMFDKWISYCAAANNGIKYIDKVLVKYRQHSSNTVGVGRSNKKSPDEKFTEKAAELQQFSLAPVTDNHSKEILREMNELFTNEWSLKRGLFFFKNINSLLIVKNKPFYRKVLYCIKMIFKPNY